MACQNKSRVWDNGWCNVACRYCTLTQEITCEHNKQTNADLIRAMSDEELAKFLMDVEQGNFTVDCCDARFCDPGHCCNDCIAAATKWLQQPAEEVNEDG